MTAQKTTPPASSKPATADAGSFVTDNWQALGLLGAGGAAWWAWGAYVSPFVEAGGGPILVATATVPVGAAAAVATWRYRRRGPARLRSTIDKGLSGAKIPATVRGMKFDKAGVPVFVALRHDPEAHLTPLQVTKAAQVVAQRIGQGVVFETEYQADERTPALLLRRVRVVAPLPESVALPLDRPLHPTRIDYGVTVGGKVQEWDLLGSPHALVTGETGAGKSGTMRALIAGIIRRGYEVRIIDPKKLEFRRLDGMAGVTRSGDGRGDRSQASIVAMIEDTHALMMDRYDMSSEELARQPRVFLVVDEFVELVLGLNRFWRANKMPGETGSEHPAVGLLVQLATLARSAGIHLLFGLQRPDVSVMGKEGGLIRDQLGHRISVGPLKSKGAQMMWDDDYELATKIPAVRADGRPLKGRALATGPTGPREVQVYWVDFDDEAVLGALSPFAHLPAPAPEAAPAAPEAAPEPVQAETAVAVLDECNVLAGNLSEGDVLLVRIDGERQARFVEEVEEAGDCVEVRWSTEDGQEGVETFDALETVVALG